MSTYYGAVMGGSSRTVLCHRITVETYTRTLPNGKTVTVRGYSRAGDAAAREEAASRERQARSQITTGIERIRSAYNGPYSHDMGTRTRVHTAVRGAGEVARGYADLARNKLNDIKETMQVGIGNFMEQAKLAGSIVGAYCEMGLNWIKNLLGLGGSKDSNRESNSPSGSARSTGSKPAKVLETQKSSTGVFNRTSPSPRVIRSTGGSRGNYIDRPNRQRR